MEAARWNQIEDLLQAALDLEPEKRAAFLDGACGDDHDLRREVDALLAHEHNAADLSQIPAIAALEVQGGLLTGRKISHYFIEKRIGAGGMGEVYEARDESLQRVVALKVLPREFVDDPDRVRRFEQEALAASRLNHPNIITIFEILGSDGAQFIATERIDGKTLRELLAQKLGAEQALDIAIQVATALKAAHTAWIIHRDIKPENLMVRDDGLVKVLDFGIAKLSEEPEETQQGAVASRGAEAGENLTVPGAVLGTANYMSPEQSRGETLDGRTDLFSLGLVLHEMVTGVRLLRASIRSAQEQLSERGRFDGVPREIERIIRKLLRTDRDERYSSASELLDDLNRAKHRLESKTARRMIGFSALAVVVALGVAAVAAFLSVSETWEERVLRDGHTAAVRQAIFSPDGSKIVSCGEDGRVIVWDFARREQIATLTSHPSHKVAFSSDGKRLATGGMDGTIVIWDAGTWTPLQRIRLHGSGLTALTFSPDGTILGTADGEKTVLWRTSDWKRIEQGPYGVVHGNFLFHGKSVLLPGTLTAIDEAGVGPPYNDKYTGTAWLALSPDALHVVGIDTIGSIWFFRLPKAGDFRHLEKTLRTQAHRDHGRAVAYSPDGQLVASGAENIILWDAATQQKIARFEYPSIVWSVVFSPDGRWLLSSHGDGAVLLWDVRERELAASLNEHSGGVRAVAFSPDGRRVASASEDRTVALWDVNSGRKEAVLLGHETRVMGVAFSKQSNDLASADQGGNVILWDLARRQPRAKFATKKLQPTYCLAFSPDGRVLATTPAIWNRSGTMLVDLVDRVWGQIYGQTFSKDGRILATASSYGEMTVWDARALQLLARHTLKGTHQITVSVSPDGKFLATGEDEGAVRLWSVSPLRELAVIGRHGARLKSVAFSPDGRFVASAGDDKMIALWDVRRRKLHARIGTHASPVYALAFSPDGSRLVSGEHDRTVRLYTRHKSVWGMRLE